MNALTQFLAGEAGRLFGVAVAVVTNNDDPDRLGRVRLKFPWVGDEHESHWARVVAPMAGEDRGLYCLPEVGDEVLVAFEHGRPELAYVLGGLWNGKDPPPRSNDGGKNDVRVLRSRSGHEVVLDDTDGREQIVIRDGSGKCTLVLDTAGGAIRIECGELTIKCDRMSVNDGALEVTK
jgi:uncharacterized protein involved in type VI secretion and phage assembly